MVTETLQEGETLLAYYPGQPVIGVFEMETSPSEWDYPQGNIWIRAKVSMSQQLAHKEQEGQPEAKNPWTTSSLNIIDNINSL